MDDHAMDDHAMENHAMDNQITSVSNPRIKFLVELRKKAKQREKTGSLVIEGTRLFMDTPEKYILEIYVILLL